MRLHWLSCGPVIAVHRGPSVPLVKKLPLVSWPASEDLLELNKSWTDVTARTTMSCRQKIQFFNLKNESKVTTWSVFVPNLKPNFMQSDSKLPPVQHGEPQNKHRQHDDWEDGVCILKGSQIPPSFAGKIGAQKSPPWDELWRKHDFFVEDQRTQLALSEACPQFQNVSAPKP